MHQFTFTHPLSSAEASLYCGEAFVLWGGWGERKRERAGHDGKGEERRYFAGDTQREPLRRRESRTRKRASSSSLYVRHTCLFRLCLSVITLVLEVWLEDRMRSNKRLELQSKVLLLFWLKMKEVFQKKSCDVTDDNF